MGVGFRFNRVATAILLASFVILLVSNVVDLLYNPDEDPPRGYSVDVGSKQPAATDAGAGDAQQEVDLASLMSNASPDRGKSVSKKCVACHTFDKGGPNRVGPNLWGIIGAKKCNTPGFTYSKALSSMQGDWSEEELFKFLKSPQSYASGTRMSFVGLSKPQDIADLLAYMKQLKQQEGE
ncbi:cytochrome C [Anaplasma marginale str. Dawn]|uniref:Cytochrome c homolog n=1 Tax=Anaplasma marginale (strain Florida) TaxID=320483 RepID=B9KHR5_ANAMF|nr:cytochrome c family protein [Anaplasma marginale]AAV86318.1 cytochrome C [Anaplasma marginale str. St. Maries]ACM49027.1 cytochrome C (cycM) [Anaplasma marginale str. Florida]AGZ78597.1 cytochrome C [Anaplasma marginale str. Gypsy Plains]AGZ79449.1 cytochrome C [Anaplasma marginale str. Dawn]AXW83797.1 cytochrome c family protein [Anaplasma marginale]